MIRPGSTSRRGVTLVEAMVAIAVLLVMMVMSLSAMQNAIELREILEQRDDTTRAARVAMGRLRRELQLAFLTEHRQAVNTYQTLFVGYDDNPDRLYFTSLSHQRLYRDTRESDQTEITVWAESSSDRRGGYTLYHREAPRIDEEPDEGGPVMPLAHDVRSFEIKYLDGTADEWRDEWDTRSADTPYRLPRAVRIGLVLIGVDPEDPERTVDLPFLTTVMLHYAQPFQRNLLQGGAAGTSASSGGSGSNGSSSGAGAGGRSSGARSAPSASGSGAAGRRR